jgi:hypothetical protein
LKLISGAKSSYFSGDGQTKTLKSRNVKKHKLLEIYCHCKKIVEGCKWVRYRAACSVAKTRRRLHHVVMCVVCGALDIWRITGKKRTVVGLVLGFRILQMD